MIRAGVEAITNRTEDKRLSGKQPGAPVTRLAPQGGVEGFGNNVAVVVMDEKHLALLAILRQPYAERLAIAIETHVTDADVGQLRRCCARDLLKQTGGFSSNQFRLTACAIRWCPGRRTWSIH